MFEKSIEKSKINSEKNSRGVTPYGMPASASRQIQRQFKRNRVLIPCHGWPPALPPEVNWNIDLRVAPMDRRSTPSAPEADWDPLWWAAAAWRLGRASKHFWNESKKCHHSFSPLQNVHLKQDKGSSNSKLKPLKSHVNFSLKMLNIKLAS